jgi:hypothetical protein
MFIFQTVYHIKLDCIKIFKSKDIRLHSVIIILFTKYINNSHVRWVPETTAWRFLRLRMEERPPAKEGSCDNTESAASDKR